MNKYLTTLAGITALSLAGAGLYLHHSSGKGSRLEEEVVMPEQAPRMPRMSYTENLYTPIQARPPVTNYATRNFILHGTYLSNTLIIGTMNMYERSKTPAQANPIPAWYYAVPNSVPDRANKYVLRPETIFNEPIPAADAANIGRRLLHTLDLAKKARDPAALKTPEDATHVASFVTKILERDPQRRESAIVSGITGKDIDGAIDTIASDMLLSPSQVREYIEFYVKFNVPPEAAKYTPRGRLVPAK